jgi:hypothetical protein
MRFLGGKWRKINCVDGKGKGMSCLGREADFFAALLTKGVSSFG